MSAADARAGAPRGAGFRSAARSDVGKVRKLNEDAYVARPEAGLWAVADGMGGLSRGDRASGALKSELEAVSLDDDLETSVAKVRSAIGSVNEELAGTRAGGPSGSTVVAMIVRGDRFACLWAGDSRLYRCAAGDLERISRDHSLVEELVASGAIKPEAARHHPLSNRITRAVGTARSLDLDRVDGRIGPRDRLLLCSDGLHGFVDADVIGERAARADIDTAADELIEAALDAGGRDNVTVVLVAPVEEHA
ncbi:MAG: serine/threonine-protein phosphatase [Geminicoccaceae bacterium]|nr:serine/threonine-protein phosphatase [Geminicoccaceae bacterium]